MAPVRWVLVVVVLCQGVVLAKKPCTEALRNRVNYAFKRADGTLEASDGTIYKKDTFWSEKRHWWTCPCLSGHCVRVCPIELASKLGLSFPSSDNVKVVVWQGEQPKWVVLSQHFKVVKEAPCTDAYELNTAEEEKDAAQLLGNGSLHYTHPNITADLQFSPPKDFCIIPQEGKEQVVLVCNGEVMAEMKSSNIKFKIYPVFFIISAICLLLTLVAFYLTPDHKNLHGLCVVCQSGCLLIMYVGLTINYIGGESNHINVCIVVAYITYYFLMTSFFWLNVMCVDIYLAFKGNMVRHRENKVKFSIYAWCTPLVIFLITLVLDLTTKSEKYSPGVGLKRCWFQGFVSELLYFNGPVLILLLLNVFMFGSTAFGLWRMKKESKQMLKSGESRVHSQHDKDKLVLYVKLFLLMGGTWLMEIISWAAGGPEQIWYITDTINSLQGVLMFWFCVWSNPNIRNSLKEKVRPSTQKAKIKITSTSGVTSVYSISSRVSEHP